MRKKECKEKKEIESRIKQTMEEGMKEKEIK